MVTSGRRRLALELHTDHDPISGWLSYDEGGGHVQRPFTGWLGLMAAIGRAAEGDPSKAVDDKAALPGAD
jgi:hypothetical protein